MGAGTDAGLDTRVGRAFDETFAPGGEWDRLLAGSRADTVFLLSDWLRAWHETLGRGVDLVLPQVRREGRLVAAAAFARRDGTLEFAGKGPSDYADVVVSSELPPDEAGRMVGRLLDAARRAVPGFRVARLARVQRDESVLPGAVFAPSSAYFATEERRVPAPTMDMSAVEDRLAKKSLKRHEKSLEKMGALTCETVREAGRILPQLDEFFDQHVRRWDRTEWPSLFLAEDQRAFYRRFTETLGASGVLRFTAIRLDGKLVAGHYGFHYAGRFTWYKPTYEPGLSKVSPGEVLLKRLLELAREEAAGEFDFTLGDEAFKLRFATRSREVIDVHLTDSRVRALARRARVRVREASERLVGAEKVNAALRRVRETVGRQLR
jgi:CelD/BcsL family acetyltransferase involved in cellulose biosynthesis